MPRKKRPRVSTSDPPPKKRTVAKVRGLIEGDAVDGLAPPNHMLPGGISGKNMFPLMGLQVGRKAAFVHPRYGDYFWSFWNNSPPSWMDPMLLATMAKKDPTIRGLLQRMVKSNKKGSGLKTLSAELGRVFEEEYLPWVIEKFMTTQDLVAEWLVINAAEEKLQAAEQEAEAARVDARRRQRKRARQTKATDVE